MFYVKFRDKDGWATAGPFNTRADADAIYDAYTSIYKYVTLIRTETVVNEETVRDSSAE